MKIYFFTVLFLLSMASGLFSEQSETIVKLETNTETL